jgi:hypothetical protein
VKADADGQPRPQYRLVIAVTAGLIAIYAASFGPAGALNNYLYQHTSPNAYRCSRNVTFILYYPHYWIAYYSEDYFTYYRWWLSSQDFTHDQFQMAMDRGF